MNLFLVDDEPLTAKWIEAILSSRESDIHIAGKAGDGEEALTKLAHCPADILITDIKMPGMDGLELIRKIKSHYPGMYIIILSSHSDFRFTSEAIRLGADDYLLKSEISDDELHQALDRFLSLQQKQSKTERIPEGKQNREGDNGNSSRKKAILSLLEYRNGRISRTEKERDLHLLKIDQGPVFCLLLKYRETPEEDSGEKTATLLAEYLDLLCDRGTVTLLDSGRICITGRITLFQSDHYEKKIISGMKSVSDRLMNDFGLLFHFGLSSIRSSGEDFFQQYEESEQVLNLQSFYISDNIPAFNITRQTELIENRRILNTKMQEMNRELSLEKGITALQKGEEILDSLGREYFLLPEDAKSLTHQIITLLRGSPLTEEETRLFNDAENYRDLKKFCLKGLKEMKEEYTRKNRLSSSVEKACEYIISHYNDSQISLINVSDYVSLNSTYLSDLFRKEMGMTFQDYISRIRLEKTEYLLENTALSISEIAGKVGFHSNSYFSRFFRKYHNMSPSEYRELKNRR